MTRRPLVEIVLAFTLGVLAAAFVSALLWAALAALVVCMVALLLTRRALWGQVGVLTAFFLLGATRFQISQPIAPNEVSRLAPALVTLTGTVVSDVEIRREAADRATYYLAVSQAEVAPYAPVLVSGQVFVRQELRSLQGEKRPVERDALPRYGDRVTLRGKMESPDGARNPGGFDWKAHLARRGVYAQISVSYRERMTAQTMPTSGETFWLRLGYALRHRLQDHATRTLPATEAAALNGILLGARGDLPADLEDAFERTGTTHILATAGLHVGMVAALLLGLFRLLPIPRRAVYLLTIASLWLYMAMAGGRPSVTRAVVMATVYLGGFALERESNPWNALALAGFVLLLYQPQNLFDAGFQMSFLTVTTILLFMPLAEGTRRRLRKRFSPERLASRWQGRLVELFTASGWLAFASQLGAAPLVAYYFNQFSLISVLANALVVPAIPLVLACGFLGAAFGAISPWLASPFDKTNLLLLNLLLRIVRGCSDLPYAAFSIASPPPPLIALYYVALFAGIAFWRKSLGRKRTIPERDP